MKYEEYIMRIAPFEDFKERASKCNDDKIISMLMKAYNKGLHDVGQEILRENNIVPHKLMSQPCTPMTFEPISARIDKNNEVILIGYLYQDRTDYKVRREYKLNNLFSDYKTNDFKHW